MRAHASRGYPAPRTGPWRRLAVVGVTDRRRREREHRREPRALLTSSRRAANGGRAMDAPSRHAALAVSARACSRPARAAGLTTPSTCGAIACRARAASSSRCSSAARCARRRRTWAPSSPTTSGRSLASRRGRCTSASRARATPACAGVIERRRALRCTVAGRRSARLAKPVEPARGLRRAPPQGLGQLVGDTLGNFVGGDSQRLDELASRSGGGRRRAHVAT